MSYLVLARKWRPQSFDDLIGQEHVSRTLANAIAANRVAHAFLFTGVRGVGKTTSARILAKALNCEHGPTAKPCLACAPCRDIASGSDVDVLEIDAASYTGVDDVRELQRTIPYRPTRDRFKIYIVDEVHMLSNNAWNAFLKTLEEPPPHVKFIFATTEVHKVPVTILSRCQRYDFKLIPSQLIAKRLRYVLEQEKIEADDLAISILAREAAGSMRDGMSLLDQAIAWGGEKLVGEEVARVLGVASRSALHEILRALVEGDAPGCLRKVAELANDGHDLGHVARDLLSLLRDLVVAKVCDDPADLLDLTDDEVRDVRALAERTSADDLIRLHQGFSRSFDDVLRSGQPRAALEMTLIRLARRPPLIPIDDLIARLGQLERRLSGRGPSTPSGGALGPASSTGGGGTRSAYAPGPPPFRPAAPPAPTVTQTAPASVIAHAPALKRESPARPETPAPAPEPRATASTSETKPPLALRPTPTPPTPSRPSSIPAPSQPRTASQAPPPPRQPMPAAVDVPAWRAILADIRKERPDIATLLTHASPLAVGPQSVDLAFDPQSFLAERAQSEPVVALLTKVARAHFRAETQVAIRLDPRANELATIAWLDETERHTRLQQARKAIAGHPLVRAAIDALGAELREVRLPEEDDA